MPIKREWWEILKAAILLPPLLLYVGVLFIILIPLWIVDKVRKEVI